MATYWITFRIKEEGDYYDRYERLTDTIQALGLHWKEPTSFYLLRCDGDIDLLADRLGGCVSQTMDLVLIATTDGRQARIIGQPSDSDLYTLLPAVKKR